MTARILALALLASAAAAAQAQTSDQATPAQLGQTSGPQATTAPMARDTEERQRSGEGTSAVRDSAARTTAVPAEGANSFTEDQARSRLGEAGYTNISALTRNDDGQWTGTASQAGRQVQVMLDYKGNISTATARADARQPRNPG
jgi:hypothetical protein